MKNIVSCFGLKDNKVSSMYLNLFYFVLDALKGNFKRLNIELVFIGTKSQFRLIAVEDEMVSNGELTTMSLKHLDFECDKSVFEEILASFAHLIMFCNSPYLSSYNKLKDKPVATVKWSRTHSQFAYK